MPQKLIQTQTQKLQQVQRLSAQQMLQVRLLEMPLAELEQNVSAELDDNPALETGRDDEEGTMTDQTSDPVDDAPTDDYESEERQDALDMALEDMGRDDRMPEPATDRQQNDNADYEERVYGDTTSFYDTLTEQMNERELSDKQHSIMEYLIGSLDDDGYLRKDLSTISDELAIYHNIDASEDEIGSVLKQLQTFDPAGIGARNLQECLLLQIERKPDSPEKDMLRDLVANHFTEFTKNHWQKIRQSTHLSDGQLETLQREVRKLNPKPGASLGETQGRNMQQITPDFIVDTDDDGNVSFTLNRGNLPELHVSPSFTGMIEAYKENKQSMNRQTKEALLYAREKVDRAQGYIEAKRQRRRTLMLTMKAIIEMQHKFFTDGDEADLKPMVLRDVEERTGLDKSTISRVSNAKYVQTKWGIFPLKFFFNDGYSTADGEELSTRKIKLALKELVDKEDKAHPLNDEQLASAMKKQGFPIARRTVAKYREQLGVPVARMRKA